MPGRRPRERKKNQLVFSFGSKFGMPNERRLELYSRAFEKVYGKVRHAREFLAFRLKQLKDKPSDAAMRIVIKDLGKKPYIRPFLGDKKNGWIVTKVVRGPVGKIGRSEKVVWMAPNIHLASPDLLERIDYESQWGRTEERRQVQGQEPRAQSAGPQSSLVQEPKTEAIKWVVNLLRTRTARRLDPKSKAQAYRNYNNAHNLAIRIPGGREEAKKANVKINRAYMQGNKAEFNAILSQTIKLVKFVEGTGKKR